jgi:hypothetical protein
MWCPSFKNIDITKIKMTPCLVKDISAELQKRLAAGETDLTLPKGTF